MLCRVIFYSLVLRAVFDLERSEILREREGGYAGARVFTGFIQRHLYVAHGDGMLVEGGENESRLLLHWVEDLVVVFGRRV